MKAATDDRTGRSEAVTGRKGSLRATLAGRALAIFSAVLLFAVSGASTAFAQARSDLIMMEDGASSALTTMGILTVIALVMGVLTVLALRDVAPARPKRGRRTSNTAFRR